MEQFNDVRLELSNKLKNIWYSDGDLSDIGNEIGVIIAKYFTNEILLEDFIYGVKHGVSLVDGSHDNSIVVKSDYNDVKYDVAVKYVQESYCDNGKSTYLLLGDVAELIKIITGQEVNVDVLKNINERS